MGRGAARFLMIATSLDVDRPGTRQGDCVTVMAVEVSAKGVREA